MSLNDQIEDLPLISINLKIFKFLSLLIVHNWRRYAAIIPYTLLNATEFLDLYYSDVAVDELMSNGYVLILLLNTLLRSQLLCWKQFEFEEFLKFLKKLYLELENSRDGHIRQMLQECTAAQRKLSKINLCIGSAACFGFATYPLFSSTRVLPFAVYIPGLDEDQSPWYEIFFVCQVIMLPVGMCMYIPFTNLVISFIAFAILMCKVLQHKLRTLEKSNKDKIFKEIISCIRYQLKLVSFVKTINDLSSNLFLLEFLLFGAMLCSMLFLVIIVNTVGQMIIVAGFITMIFSQSFATYYYANELFYQSLEVAIAAYDCDWYEFDVRTQKTVKLMILRSQKPCAILLGHAYPMNMHRLQALINVTYSYYTLLKRVYG